MNNTILIPLGLILFISCLKKDKMSKISILGSYLAEDLIAYSNEADHCSVLYEYEENDVTHIKFEKWQAWGQYSKEINWKLAGHVKAQSFIEKEGSFYFLFSKYSDSLCLQKFNSNQEKEWEKTQYFQNADHGKLKLLGKEDQIYLMCETVFEDQEVCFYQWKDEWDLIRIIGLEKVNETLKGVSISDIGINLFVQNVRGNEEDVRMISLDTLGLFYNDQSFYGNDGKHQQFIKANNELLLINDEEEAKLISILNPLMPKDEVSIKTQGSEETKSFVALEDSYLFLQQDFDGITTTFKVLKTGLNGNILLEKSLEFPGEHEAIDFCKVREAYFLLIKADLGIDQGLSWIKMDDTFQL